MSFEKPSRVTIRSHRAGAVGRAVVAYKKAWQKVLGPVLDSLVEAERDQVLRAVSERMDGLLQVLDRRQGALEVDLIVLTERIRKLERDSGLADEVRLTNAALLEGREKLAALREELDGLRAEVAGQRRAPVNGTTKPTHEA